MNNWQDIFFGCFMALTLAVILYALWKANIRNKHSEKTKKEINR